MAEHRSADCPSQSPDPTSLILGRLFVRAVQASLLSTLSAAGACGEDSVSTVGFSKVPCDQVADITTAQPVDFIALRSFDRELDDEPRQFAQRGEPCAGASDESACTTELASTDGLIANNVGLDHEVVRYLTITRGDEVSRIEEPDEVRALLLPIDTAADAVLLAMFEGYSTNCDSPEESGVLDVGSGYEVIGSRVTSTCTVEETRYRLQIARDGRVRVLDQAVSSTSDMCIGRRPAGLYSQVDSQHASDVARFFARVQHLEAASVHAFVTLARELCALGAPDALVQSARQAAREEVRHAVLMARLARRFGATTTEPEVHQSPLRSLAQLSLDNAVEGCVRETLGALIGTFQATRAEDPEVRQTMSIVAEDETRHASLAWQIAAWAEPQLSETERAELAAERRRAIDALRADLTHSDESDPTRALLGLPCPVQVASLVESLEQTLWRQTPRAA